MGVRLVMLGPPGAGKGTQAERYARNRGIPRVSTGDILRDAVQSGSEMGVAAKIVMDAGRLVSDEIMIGIVTERLSRPDAADGFVLDGFPRTVGQAEALDDWLTGPAPLVVVDIEVPEETLVRRLGFRRICSKCGTTASPAEIVCGKCGGALVQRRDDNLDVVRERLRVYARNTQPLVEFYQRRPSFRSVDGDQTQDHVAADIAAAVASVIGGRG
ncbi:MAG TPA: adenylate kinase [Vicinamibacterales bacterium]|nr:adenylate kinase [Vicinamibacterales bacterium]